MIISFLIAQEPEQKKAPSTKEQNQMGKRFVDTTTVSVAKRKVDTVQRDTVQLEQTRMLNKLDLKIKALEEQKKK